jgi:hypothetical protein
VWWCRWGCGGGWGRKIAIERQAMTAGVFLPVFHAEKKRLFRDRRINRDEFEAACAAAEAAMLALIALRPAT